MRRFEDLSSDGITASISDSTDWILLFIFAAGFVHAAYYLLLGIANPLLDFYSFRQTQTALSAYWMWRGGPWLAYETPVLGYPWAIPFEVPIFRGWSPHYARWAFLSTLAAAFSPLAFISAAFGPCGHYLELSGCRKPRFSPPARCFCGRHFTRIGAGRFSWKSCALFFCLLWLALLARFLQTATVGSFIGAMLAGLAGILCKVTTFPAVAALGGIMVLADAYRAWSAGMLITRLRVYALAATLVIVPLAAEIAWVAYSDALKEKNPFGAALLTSKGLFTWFYGTWKQRVGPDLWRIIWDRSLPEIFGSTAILAAIIAGMGLFSRRYVVPILAAVLAFMIPFLVFTNVHIIHNYYQNANAVFALAALGIAIAAIAEDRQRLLAPLLLAVFVSGQIYFFHRHYVPVIAADYSNDRVFRISLLARKKTQPTESLIVFGQDWSSAVAYYSERKTLTMPKWAPATLMQKILENPQAYLGDARLGGIVMCPEFPSQTLSDLRNNYAGRMALVDAFVAGHAIIGEVQGCQLLAPNRDQSRAE